MAGIVVVGAGQAGAALVAKLRALGHSGPITLLGSEPAPPYQRPPLSKAYLTGEMPVERLYLRPEAFYADNDIRLVTDTSVHAIDTAAQRIAVGSETLPYERLALTTGARARALPAEIGGARAGVYCLRSIADADALRPELRPGRQLIVVGGGYIGLEAAAVAAGCGLEVTVLEAADRILQRVACDETADWFRALHQRNGVDIREGVKLVRLTGSARVDGAELSDGTHLPADLVIVGIGIEPRTRLAREAGLAIENGIAIDERGRSSVPGVWAAGDCASFPYRSDRIRLESVQNAVDQAECVAADMLGEGYDYAPVPWFWSDQYHTRLQIAGLGSGHDRIATRVDGDEARSHWYFSGARLLAVDAINAPRAYMVGKRLLQAGRSPEPEAVAASDTDLKQLLV